MYTIQVVLWATNHGDHFCVEKTRHMRSSGFSTVWHTQEGCDNCSVNFFKFMACTGFSPCL